MVSLKFSSSDEIPMLNMLNMWPEKKTGLWHQYLASCLRYNGIGYCCHWQHPIPKHYIHSFIHSFICSEWQVQI